MGTTKSIEQITKDNYGSRKVFESQYDTDDDERTLIYGEDTASHRPIKITDQQLVKIYGHAIDFINVAGLKDVKLDNTLYRNTGSNDLEKWLNFRLKISFDERNKNRSGAETHNSVRFKFSDNQSERGLVIEYTRNVTELPFVKGSNLLGTEILISARVNKLLSEFYDLQKKSGLEINLDKNTLRVSMLHLIYNPTPPSEFHPFIASAANDIRQVENIIAKYHKKNIDDYLV